jgi:hypothetical protein
MGEVPPARLLILLALAALTVTATTGCGSSGNGGAESDEAKTTATATTPPAPPGASARSCEGTVAGTGEVRVTGIGCDVGRGVVAAWANKPDCSVTPGATRFSCAVLGGYRCLGAATDRGFAVSCARPGSSVAFVAKRG